MNPNIVNSIQLWLKTVIIEYSICPFAQHEFDNNRIHYCIDSSNSIEENAQLLIAEIQRLERNDTIETTLIIYPEQFIAFDDFLNYVEISDELLIMQGYEGIYQIASFHPEYCFADSDLNDAANYTNRSPYPMIHLIRESSIERVLRFYSHPEKIPERNIALTRKLGLSKMQTLLAACRS